MHDSSKTMGVPDEEYLLLLGKASYLYSSLLRRFVDDVSFLFRQVAVGSLRHERGDGRLIRSHLYGKMSSGSKLDNSLSELKAIARLLPSSEEHFALFESYLQQASALLSLSKHDSGITAVRNMLAHSSPSVSPFQGYVLRREYVKSEDGEFGLPDVSSRLFLLDDLRDLVLDLEGATSALLDIERSIPVVSDVPFMSTLYDVHVAPRMSVSEIVEEHQRVLRSDGLRP